MLRRGGGRRARKDYRLYTLPRPGDEVQVDTKYLELIPGTGRRWYQYTAVDDCSRVRVLRIYDDLSVHHSLAFLREVVAALPAWEHRYNYLRGHQSLHGLSPMEYLAALQSTSGSVTYVRV